MTSKRETSPIEATYGGKAPRASIDVEENGAGLVTITRPAPGDTFQRRAPNCSQGGVTPNNESLFTGVRGRLILRSCASPCNPSHLTSLCNMAGLIPPPLGKGAAYETHPVVSHRSRTHGGDGGHGYAGLRPGRVPGVRRGWSGGHCPLGGYGRVCNYLRSRRYGRCHPRQSGSPLWVLGVEDMSAYRNVRSSYHR